MMLRTLEIPDDPSQRIQWLDQQLADYHLPEVVTELLTLLDLPLQRPVDLPAVDDWLGNRRAQFLASGAAALDERQRRDLLRRPWLLLDLQAEIDAGGGEHWNAVAERSPALVAARERVGERVREGTREGSQGLSRTAKTGRRRYWLTLGATAAAVAFLGLCLRAGWKVGPEPPPAATGWGWNESELFAGSPTETEYLNRLADAGAKWHNKRPETKSAVARRIHEMRAGCQRLIDRDHPPLAPAQNVALKQLCRKWAGEFDLILADLEADRKSPQEARDAMDGIVEKLVGRLRSGKLT